MTDLTAGLLASALVLVALASYRHRLLLQPNRAGAAIYLAGAVAWGVAVMLLWVAWASTGAGDVCHDGACDTLAETFEGAELSPEFLTGQEAISEALAD